MEQIRHINRCNTLQDRAVLTEDGSFCVPCLMETGIMKTRSERKGRHIQPLTDRRTTGQSWQTPLFGRQGRALRVSGKNHPRPEGLRYFFRKPCLSGSVCRKALVVQRAAKAQVFTIKIDIYILQCTKLKIGCLICKYRFFSLKIHIQGKIQVIQSQPQWLAFFIFFENFSENSAKSGFVW